MVTFCRCWTIRAIACSQTCSRHWLSLIASSSSSPSAESAFHWSSRRRRNSRYSSGHERCWLFTPADEGAERTLRATRRIPTRRRPIEIWLNRRKVWASCSIEDGNTYCMLLVGCVLCENASHIYYWASYILITGERRKNRLVQSSDGGRRQKNEMLWLGRKNESVIRYSNFFAWLCIIG